MHFLDHFVISIIFVAMSCDLTSKYAPVATMQIPAKCLRFCDYPRYQTCLERTKNVDENRSRRKSMNHARTCTEWRYIITCRWVNNSIEIHSHGNGEINDALICNARTNTTDRHGSLGWEQWKPCADSTAQHSTFIRRREKKAYTIHIIWICHLRGINGVEYVCNRHRSTMWQ